MIAPLEKEEELLIKKLFVPINLNKGELLVESGKVAKYLGFIEKGLFRHFLYKQNADEITLDFAAENNFVTSYGSLISRVSSITSVQAIEDCELLVIDNQGLEQLYNKTKNGNLIGRKLLEYNFAYSLNHLFSTYLNSSQERYQNFLDNYSHLIQRIPQYLIASYVGVQPQSLSRIRKRMAKK